MTTAPPAARESLRALIPGPAIWAAHFTLSYVSGAIWCAKHAGPSGEIGPVRIAVAAYTIVALLLIALSAHRSLSRHSLGEYAGRPHDEDAPDDRHRFLGFISVLLCGLAAIATLYTAMVVLIVRSCA